MSSVEDISAKLGEYMLKGWILTDQTCKSLGCSVPMMRSPNGRIPVTHFCVKCDDSTERLSTTSKQTSDSALSMSSESHFSRSSTPPTEASSALSSPVFAPPIDTDESRRRREQSDTASSEIGKRLLKGWAMLGEECPNTRCYGVPLVRPPRSGDRKDPRKECVICGVTFITEVDSDGRERLAPVNSATQQANNSTASIYTPQETLEGKLGRHERPVSVALTEQVTQLFPLSPTPVVHSQHKGPSTAVSPLEVLEEASTALQSTLRVLSARISHLSDPRNLGDSSSIKGTADNISSVVKALTNVRQLQWSENQAQRL